jgi:MoxR-like ATPase
MISQATAAASHLQQSILHPMKSAFVGKDLIIDLMGIALASGENLFLLGPPGTAKSALVHHLSLQLGARSFDYLLTRFTEPNELFGPFDIRRLREGELITNTGGMLPEAELIFLDELLNANSAILNSLLTILNERRFRRGGESRPIPALFIAAASNHLPEEESLRALFDRFLLRVPSLPAPDDQLDAVLDAGWQILSQSHPPPPAASLTDSIRLIQAAIPSVSLRPARETCLSLIRSLRTAGISISDRRAVRLQRAIAASALLAGRTEARPSDLWIMAHSWDREEQIEIAAAIVADSLRPHEPSELDHPRAFAPQEPEPENLHRELQTLSARLKDPTPDPSAPDALRAISERIQWIRNPLQRATLETLCQSAWQSLSGNSQHTPP